MKKLFIILLSLFSCLLINPKPIKANLIIKGPIFKVADTINLTGNIDGDVFLLGGDVTVDATISGDLLILAGQAHIKGEIKDDLRIVAGQIDLDAITQGNSTLIAGQTRLASNAKLNQDLYLKTLEDPIIDNKATISGTLIKNKISTPDFFKNTPKITKVSAFKRLTTLVIVQKLVALSLEFLIGALIIVLLPKITKKLSELSQREPTQTIGWGFLTLITVPVLSLLLFISLIGIPVAVLVLMLFSFSIYSARLLASLSLGGNLIKDTKFQKPFHGLALGLVILNLLKLIPILGWFVYFVFILNGLGTLSLFTKTAFNKRKK